MDSSAALDPRAALAHWHRRGPVRDVPDPGLINVTWTAGEPPDAILQWVNPIFDGRIHLDIEAVTGRLAAAGVATPRLIPTPDGRLWMENESGCWRLMTFFEGQTLHRLEDHAQAAAAGGLVGRFHAALAGWRPTMQAPRRAIHDTLARLDQLRAALEECDGHPLAGPTRALGREILDDWAAWDGDLELPEHLCHGDLKISNVRFDSDGREALCLIDLDTLEPMPYACELGDAWRSWCNPAGEDEPDLCRFEVELFDTSARAWFAEAPPLEDRERRSLVPGIERICLELAARFAADAVRNTYFREDAERFPELGTHNLARALGQLRLARSARAQRAECEAIVRDATS